MTKKVMVLGTGYKDEKELAKSTGSLLLTLLAIFSGIFAIVFPPLLIVTIIAIISIFRINRRKQKK